MFPEDTFGAVSMYSDEQGKAANVTLWFNNGAYHAIPVMTSLWNNARFRMLGFDSARTTVWSHPLPKTQVVTGPPATQPLPKTSPCCRAFSWPHWDRLVVVACVPAVRTSERTSSIPEVPKTKRPEGAGGKTMTSFRSTSACFGEVQNCRSASVRQRVTTSSLGKRLCSGRARHKTQALLQDEMTGSHQVFTDLTVAITVILAMGFIPASFVVYLVHEKASSGKHQQLLAGISPVMCWVNSFAWDMVNFFVPLIVCFIIFMVFQVGAYSGGNSFAVFLLLLLYGLCMTPCMYCVEPLFKARGVMMPSTAPDRAVKSEAPQNYPKKQSPPPRKSQKGET